MLALPTEPPRPAPSRRYIDLARLGRTDAGSSFKGLAWILIHGIAGFAFGLVAGGIILVAAARLFLSDSPSMGSYTPAGLFCAKLGAILGFLKGAHYATVHSQRRPFWSLIGPTPGFQIGRVMVGIVAALVVEILVEQTISTLIDPASGVFPDWIVWPSSVTDWEWLLASILVIPIEAGCEELFFRGWLTQSIGQVVRSRFALVLIVALLFALSHEIRHEVLALPFYMLMSLGFSALSLWDCRLELAMGAHIAHNWLAVAVTSRDDYSSLPGKTDLMLQPIDLVGVGLQMVILFAATALLRRKGWLTPSAA